MAITRTRRPTGGTATPVKKSSSKGTTTIKPKVKRESRKVRASKRAAEGKSTRLARGEVTPDPITPKTKTVERLSRAKSILGSGGARTNIPPAKSTFTPTPKEEKPIVQEPVVEEGATPAQALNQIGTSESLYKPTPIETVTSTPTYTPYDPTDEIKALTEAMKSSQIERLKQRMMEAQGGIEQRRSEIPDEYREQKRQANVQSKLGNKNFGEYLASRGIARGGEANQARLMQNMGLQQQLGGIGLQQQSEMDRLAREEQQLQNQYTGDVGLAQSNADVEALRMLIDAKTRGADISRKDALRQEDISRKDALRQEDISREDMINQQNINKLLASQYGFADPYGGQRLTEEQRAITDPYSDDIALALQNPNLDQQTRQLLEQARFEKVLGSQDLREQYGRDYMTPQAIAQQEQDYAQSISNNAIPDYQAEINKVAGDNDPTNDWKLPLLQAERQMKLAGIQEAEQTRQDEQIAEEDRLRKQQIEDEELRLKQQKSEYDINKPYYAPKTSTEPKPSSNELYADAYQSIKQLSWDDAQSALIDNKAELLSSLGTSKYKQLWDDVFADAIRAGRPDFKYDTYWAKK